MKATNRVKLVTINSALRSRLARWAKPKFVRLKRVSTAPRYILDIGIANDSYHECKAIFPDAVYHGVDYVAVDVALDEGDSFFLRNLEEADALKGFPPIYDLIIANHVLEHLRRGVDVFSELCAMLAPKGALYVEVPSIRTAYKAKTNGSYHFHDDPTHCTFYRLEDLANIAIRAGCEVVSCGPVSTTLKDVLSVPRAAIGVATGKDWGPYLVHLGRKIDHILVQRRG